MFRDKVQVRAVAGNFLGVGSGVKSSPPAEIIRVGSGVENIGVGSGVDTQARGENIGVGSGVESIRGVDFIRVGSDVDYIRVGSDVNSSGTTRKLLVGTLKFVAAVYIIALAIVVIVATLIGALLMALTNDELIQKIKLAVMPTARDLLRETQSEHWRAGYSEGRGSALDERGPDADGQARTGPMDLGSASVGRHATVEDGGTIPHGRPVIRASTLLRQPGKRDSSGSPKHAAPVGD